MIKKKEYYRINLNINRSITTCEKHKHDKNVKIHCMVGTWYFFHGMEKYKIMNVFLSMVRLLGNLGGVEFEYFKYLNINS